MVVQSPTTQDVFKYNNSIKKFFIIFLTVWIFIWLITFRIQLNLWNQVTLIKFLAQAFVSLVLPTSIIFRLIFNVRPWLYSSFVLGNSKILKRKSSKLVELTFAQIESIQPTFMPPLLFGGFKLISKSGHAWYFSSILDNSYQIIERILLARPDLNSNRIHHQLLPEIKRVKLNWDRAIRRFQNWIWTLFKFVGIPLLTSVSLVRRHEVWLSVQLTTYEKITITFIIFLFLISILQLFVSLLEEEVRIKAASLFANVSRPSWETPIWILNQMLLFVLFFLIFKLLY